MVERDTLLETSDQLVLERLGEFEQAHERVQRLLADLRLGQSRVPAPEVKNKLQELEQTLSLVHEAVDDRIAAARRAQRTLQTRRTEVQRKAADGWVEARQERASDDELPLLVFAFAIEARCLDYPLAQPTSLDALEEVDLDPDQVAALRRSVAMLAPILGSAAHRQNLADDVDQVLSIVRHVRSA